MISIIITTYKRPDNLERAINSILNQTYKNYEIIVVDDNDSGTEYRKETEQIMNNYQRENILYIRHECNKNGAAARNTGIRRAKGEFITFLDDDDYFMPERLEKMYKLLKNNPEYDCAYSSVAISEKQGFVDVRKANRSGVLLYETLCHDTCWVTGSNILFTERAIRTLGEFDETFNRHQDTEYLVRFFAEGFRILALEDVLVVKNQNDRMNDVNVKKQVEIKEKFLGKFKHIIPEEKWNEINYANYFIVLWLCIKNRNLKEYKEIKELVEKYGKISLKTKIKIAARWIYCMFPLNSYLLAQRKKRTQKQMGNEFQRLDSFIRETER